MLTCNGKTQKFSEIIVLLHSHSQRFFANVSLKFSNINNTRMTSVHVAILASFMQLIEEYEGQSKITEPCLITFELSKMDIYLDDISLKLYVIFMIT